MFLPLCAVKRKLVCVCVCVYDRRLLPLCAAQRKRDGARQRCLHLGAGTAALLSSGLLEPSVPLLTDKHRDRIPLSPPYQAICTALHNLCHNLLGVKAANLFIWQPLCPWLLPGQVFCGTAISDRQHRLTPVNRDTCSLQKTPREADEGDSRLIFHQ